MEGDWKNEGADSLLIKPMNTSDLLRQIEALLVTHQDSKQVATVKPEIAGDVSKRGQGRAAAAKANSRKSV